MEDLSKLEYEHAAKVRQAWVQFQSNFQMTTLLDAINPFLPASLKEMGGNPLKTLYQQTSEGIHEFSEDECLKKASDIDKLLRYVIRRISSLKQEFLEIRSSLKNLNS